MAPPRNRFPSLLKQKMIHAYLDLVDAGDLILGKRRPLVPPRRLAWSTGTSQADVGGEFLRHFVSLGSLTPDESVLDVGCGVGRMALSLTRHLSAKGRYEGFDIMKDAVRWCSREISARYRNFQFQWVPVYNREYNPNASMRAKDLKFPYPDQQFDFVFLTSVFTHMFPEDVGNYLAETRRVLRPGGRCLISWFILDPISRASMDNPGAALNFSHAVSGCFTARPELPESAIGFDLDAVNALYAGAGLEAPRMYPGSWSGRDDALSFQDILVSRPLVS